MVYNDARQIRATTVQHARREARRRQTRMKHAQRTWSFIKTVWSWIFQIALFIAVLTFLQGQLSVNRPF
jgi:hypothetical protein